MSAKVTPVSVRGSATLSNIALRASSDVPPRHQPDEREQRAAKRAARKAQVVLACNMLADSMQAQLDRIQASLEETAKGFARLEAKRST